MFGSLKVNGTKVVRQITAKEALPGFFVVVSLPPDWGTVNNTTKVGDLVLKHLCGFTRIHENPTNLNWVEKGHDANIIVQYADVELTFNPVKDE